MKPIWKYTILLSLALLIVVLMVLGLRQSRRAVATPVCEHLVVQIQDIDQRQLVNEAEIKQLLANKGLSPEGKKVSQIELCAIEHLVKCHAMVRQAECFHTIQGDVVVRINQRIPLFHVLTACETYYIDTDRKMMPPHENISTPFMAIGQVSHRMAREELYDFAMWLQQHPYWDGQISGVDVVSPKCVELVHRGHNADIILGEWRGFDRKLNKLQHWYEAGKDLDLEKYTKVDVRYRGQVIGINQ